MVSVLDSGSRGPGSSPGRGHCVVRLYSHHTGVQRGIASVLVTLRWTNILSTGE